MRLLFMGRKASGARALQWSVEAGFEVVGVITDTDNPDSGPARIARRHRLPLWDYQTAVHRAETGALEVDVATSFVFWKIIDEPLLSAPRLGIVNFHPAPLPEYRGTAGYNLAILEELDTWGVSAHYMDDDIDTGGIIDTFEFSIDPARETARTLEQKSQEFMVDLYCKTMRRILRRDDTLETTPNEGGRYVSRREMEAMKRVEPGDDVDKKIRAFWFPPYHGAHIELAGEKYTLLNERMLEALSAGDHEPVAPRRPRRKEPEIDEEPPDIDAS